MDIASIILQTLGVLVGCGKSLFTDEARLFGLDGRKLARICLISSVGFLAADQTREAVRTKSPVQVNGAAILGTITVRSILLYVLRNQTQWDKRLRRVVSDGAFVTGTALSISGQLAGGGCVTILPTAFSTAGLWFGCQMDRQDKQENANRLLLAAGTCMFGFGCVSGAIGIMAKTFLVDISVTSVNTYKNYVRDRYDGSISQKITAYIKDTAREVLALWG